MCITIILTSTVNINLVKRFLHQKDKNDRINTYLKSIRRWLNETKFNIVLVENSGHIFSELENEQKIYNDRFEIITFNEKEVEEAKYLINITSKGASEMFSINYAFTHSKIIKNTQPIFIIKVTCRYFIPELEKYLKQYDLNNYDCLVQRNPNRCELVGSHYNNFNNIFNINLLDENNNYNGLVEHIWKYRTSICKNKLVCKLFNIEKTHRGGVNEFFLFI